MNSITQVNTFREFTIFELTPVLVEKYSEEMCAALDQIPLVEPHTKEYLLSDTKGDRVLYAKWQHSLIALDNEDKFAGLIIGYERKSEGNEQYPENSIYLSDFATAATHQKKGLGKYLLKTWLEFNTEKGFLELDDELKFSVQTNAAEWNAHVQGLYESFGFIEIARKKYDNREDGVFWYTP
jgi:ribosomal protein S18 acetylase RimI-like enzyme